MSDDDAGGDPHEFVFKLDKAVRAQVVERLESSPMLPLKREVAKWHNWEELRIMITYLYTVAPWVFRSLANSRPLISEIGTFPGLVDSDIAALEK